MAHAGPATPRACRGFLFGLAASFTGMIWAAAALAGCQEQLRLLADELHGRRLTQQQTYDVAAAVLEARRWCWVQQEKPAIALISRARSIAGLPPITDSMDWETVPLESLEKK